MSITNVVIDSSVAIKWFMVEPHSEEALRSLAQYEAGEIALYAPDLFYAEIGNVIWKKQRFSGLLAEEAERLIQVLQLLRINLVSTAVLLDDAYRLAVEYQRSVYDALYLALSVRERCKLLTADEKLVHALEHAFPDVTFVGDWR